MRNWRRTGRNNSNPRPLRRAESRARREKRPARPLFFVRKRRRTGSRQNRGMKIQKDTVVTLRYKVAEANGKLIEDSREPMAYLHGGYDNTLPKIESALDGQEPGYEVTLQLKPEDAFGLRDESLVRTIPKKEFPPGVKVGGQLEGHTDAGAPHVFHVMKIKGDTVFLDGNHPLAGRQLRFLLKVTGVRAATAEEISHRHVHGAHGHQH